MRALGQHGRVLPLTCEAGTQGEEEEAWGPRAEGTASTKSLSPWGPWCHPRGSCGFRGVTGLGHGAGDGHWVVALWPASLWAVEGEVRKGQCRRRPGPEAAPEPRGGGLGGGAPCQPARGKQRCPDEAVEEGTPLRPPQAPACADDSLAGADGRLRTSQRNQVSLLKDGGRAHGNPESFPETRQEAGEPRGGRGRTGPGMGTCPFPVPHPRSHPPAPRLVCVGLCCVLTSRRLHPSSTFSGSPLSRWTPGPSTPSVRV